MEQQIPSISAILPTHNRADLLSRAIDSIFDQTYQPAEIIVVDDGSDDETAEVVSNYGDSIQYHYQENSGVSGARNHGAQLATSPWIAYLDSDDEWDAGYLQRIANAIGETDGAADIYFSDCLLPMRPGIKDRSLWRNAGFRINGRYRLVEDGSDWVLMSVQPFRVQGAVFWRSKYLGLGGHHEDMRIREDQHLFLKLGLGSAICAVKGIAVHCSNDAANRLSYTQTHRAWSKARAFMYSDLLARIDLPPQTRATLKERCGEAFYALASHDWQEHKWLDFFTDIFLGLRYHPAGLVHRIQERI